MVESRYGIQYDDWLDTYLQSFPCAKKDFKEEWNEILTIYRFVTKEDQNDKA